MKRGTYLMFYSEFGNSDDYGEISKTKREIER